MIFALPTELFGGDPLIAANSAGYIGSSAGVLLPAASPSNVALLELFGVDPSLEVAFVTSCEFANCIGGFVVCVPLKALLLYDFCTANQVVWQRSTGCSQLCWLYWR